MKSTIVQPYLFFNGRCEEAVKFYQSAIGAKVEMLLRFKESPEAPPPGTNPPNWGDKVMHCSFRVGDSVIMASDGCETSPAFAGFSLSLSLPTPEEVDRAYAALAAGGKADMPPTKTFWSPRFGMLTDKFGLGWMVGVAG
ncbi:MAG TPA: VOC family protein [Opitutaceae bacterium]|nr:VOC family protein [Opitutaceae bacterium]